MGVFSVQCWRLICEGLKTLDFPCLWDLLLFFGNGFRHIDSMIVQVLIEYGWRMDRIDQMDWMDRMDWLWKVLFGIHLSAGDEVAARKLASSRMWGIEACICHIFALYLPYVGVLLGLSRLYGHVTADISFNWGMWKGVFPLIGVLIDSHHFEEPHDFNDLVSALFPKVPQLVHKGYFWFPVRGDWIAFRTQLG